MESKEQVTSEGMKGEREKVGGGCKGQSEKNKRKEVGRGKGT